VFDDQHFLFRQRYIELDANETIVATTDGVTEARSPGGEFYGMDRFVAVVAAHARDPVRDIPRAVIDDVEAFTGGPLHDDIAIFAVRVK
jgi:sigma-B regulation protein RsbU (phosphoserine phosphatase)